MTLLLQKRNLRPLGIKCLTTPFNFFDSILVLFCHVNLQTRQILSLFVLFDHSSGTTRQNIQHQDSKTSAQSWSVSSTNPLHHHQNTTSTPCFQHKQAGRSPLQPRTRMILHTNPKVILKDDAEEDVEVEEILDVEGPDLVDWSEEYFRCDSCNIA